MDATVGPHLPIEFEEDCISLQLPSKEESLESGWKIVPLFHPQVGVSNFSMRIMKFDIQSTVLTDH